MDSIREKGHSVFLLNLLKLVRCHQLFDKAIHSKKQSMMSWVCLHNSLPCFHKGIAVFSSPVILELCLNRVIEADVESRELLRVNGEDVNGIEHNQLLDLNDDGERWEGDVLNNKPYGWGVLYDSENRMTYEGFRIGEVNVCYGRSYYPDIQKVEYEGEICEGKRWGRGVQYDRTGKIVIDGEWMNDVDLEGRIEIIDNNSNLHNHIEELVVSSNCCNGKKWSVIDFTIIPHLREIRVGDKCFDSVNEFKLIGLNELERVVIGKSFNYAGNHPIRVFYVKDCGKLKELKLGTASFCNYNMCGIENNESLEVIEIGELNRESFNFQFASLELKSDSQRVK